MIFLCLLILITYFFFNVLSVNPIFFSPSSVFNHTMASTSVHSSKDEQHTQSSRAVMLILNLQLNICIPCIQQNHIPPQEKVQFQASQSDLSNKENRDRTHQNKPVMSECCVIRPKKFCGKWGVGVSRVFGGSIRYYQPGGGETSREISGRGGAPLLSGATLSEHVTNIQWWMEELLLISTKL